MRRILTIIAVAIVVIGLLVLGYFIFFAGSGAGLSVESGVPGQNPFGSPSANTSAPTGTSADNTGGGSSPIAGTQVAPHLVKITSTPVARGFVVLDASTTPVSPADASSTPSVPSFSVEARYIDRQSGNMYSYNLTDGTSVRLTDHTAPGVEEASWTADGSTAFIRFLTTDTDKSEHIDTYALPADGSDGRFLARDLSEVATQGTGSLFTLMPSTTGSVGTISKSDGSGGATLFTSPLSALSVSFNGPNLLAYTKPSENLNGYAFTIDRKSGAFTAVAGPLSALSALPGPSGKQALISYLMNGAFSLGILDEATHGVTPLPVATFAEKCVWATDGQSAYCAVPSTLAASDLPDTWYEGTVSFSDRIWKIDLVARVATLVADLPTLSPSPIDAVSLSIDTQENALVFMNKRDGSLWAYTF